MARNRHFNTGITKFGESGGSKGMDVIAYGDTADCYMEWDASLNKFLTRGAGTAAAGAIGYDVQITQGSTALTGTLRGIYSVATNGTTAATGTIRGAEIKARAADPSNVGANAAMLEGILVSADAKNKTATGLRGIHIQVDGAAGGSSTLAQGLLINNNSSAVQTTSYAVDINEGTASGHKAFTADIRLQNGETIDNATNGTVAVTAAVLKQAYDAAAYWTATQADGGGVTFDSVSDGTAGFTFSDPVTVGVNDTGHDVKFFGATSGKYCLWDESEDTLSVLGKVAITQDASNTAQPFKITATSASTSASDSMESMLVSTTMTGAGGVGGRARFALAADAALGGWANALKAITTFGASTEQSDADIAADFPFGFGPTTCAISGFLTD